MATEEEVLSALSGILADMSVPASSAALGGVYIWPDDYDDMPDVLTLPSILVAKRIGRDARGSVARKAHGLERHSWEIDVLTYLAEGPLTTLDSYAAEAEAAANGWVLALSNVLWGNMKLSSTVDLIGEANGDLFEIFRYTEGHIPFGNKNYWGIVLTLRVMQTRTVEMRS